MLCGDLPKLSESVCQGGGAAASLCIHKHHSAKQKCHIVHEVGNSYTHGELGITATPPHHVPKSMALYSSGRTEKIYIGKKTPLLCMTK